MKTWAFAVRTTKEILRDPLNVAFGLGFPVALLLLLSAIQANIPVELFVIERLAPGICVFGLSFLCLFSATLVAKDRESALLERLYTTPLRSVHFILGYSLPMLPMGLAQSALCYAVALCLGLPFTVGILYSLLASLPVALFFISAGVLFGSVLGVKAVGGLCGGLFTNLAAWLSGVWFDLELVGGAFLTIANLLPFAHAVRVMQETFCEGFPLVGLLVVAGYAVATAMGASLLFLRQMKKR